MHNKTFTEEEDRAGGGSLPAPMDRIPSRRAFLIIVCCFGCCLLLHMSTSITFVSVAQNNCFVMYVVLWIRNQDRGSRMACLCSVIAGASAGYWNHLEFPSRPSGIGAGMT